MAINSSSIVPITKRKNGRALVNEKIDERILRLLGLEDVFDIDYDTYSTLLKEAMVKGRMPKTSIPTEEIELVTGEWKRVKGKSGRFKVKKITAASFKKGTAVGVNLGKKKLLTGIRPLALPPAVDKMSGGDDLTEIRDLLGNIIKNLTQQNKAQKDATERSRKEAENAKRALAESNLEKGFKFAIKAAEKVIAPVKSLLSRIIDFFMAIFWGKVFLKLLDWFAEKENKKKIDSLFRFFGDHWPKLLALYLRFGTGLGKFVGGFTKLVFFGTRKLLQVVASMVGAKGAARFLGGRGGRFVAAGLQVATTVGTTMALSGGIENFVGGGKEKEDNFKIPTFSGGGLSSLKKLFGFYGGGPGRVSGQKGVDKIPAMLSDGEFVMSRGAVQKYGVGTLESMNAAGGGTNRPKMISGTTYAAGGGLIGYAGDMIKHHEALSSLQPGQNYYVSVKSPEYRKVSNTTKIYPYLDSVNVPTIGWGATYYDSLLKGSKKVKMSDPPITKAAADNLLTKHLSQLIPLAKSKLPLWNKMSPQQQGTVISFLYNAGPNSIDPKGPYPKFSRALIAGNMIEASRNTTRGGPAPSRINEERKLLSTGPSDLTKVKQPTSTRPNKEPNIFERLSSGFSSMIGKSGSVIAPPAQAKEPRYAKGGMVPARLSKAPANIKNISPPAKPSVVVRTMSSSKPENMNIPGAPGAPRLPSFSSARIDKERRRILDIHSIG
jgi:GH24 family phage-related lysozyme (muramidase)